MHRVHLGLSLVSSAGGAFLFLTGVHISASLTWYAQHVDNLIW
jgi:hypothetical protein